MHVITTCYLPGNTGPDWLLHNIGSTIRVILGTHSHIRDAHLMLLSVNRDLLLDHLT
jgi:hypothetical protein